MAEQAEKSNWVPLAVVMGAITITLVLTLKARETEHWERSTESLEENANALQGVTRYQNNFTE